MKSKEFIDNFKIEKALGDYSQPLAYADKLSMNNCVYKVLKSDKQYTLLQDDKNLKFAIPTNKLQLMLKKGYAQNLGVLNFVKAFKRQLSGPSAKVGVSPSALKQAAVAKTPSSAGTRGEPVGTVHTGADGHQYKKVSANPAKWVHVGEGTSHDKPGEEAHHALSNPKDMDMFHNMLGSIHAKTHPEDHDKLKKLAMEWVEATHKFKNMRAAHSAQEIDDKGKPMQRTGLASSTMNNVFAQQDRALEKRKKLRDAIVASAKKLKESK